jgi:phage tail tube protein FII
MANVSFNTLLEAVESHANTYQQALVDLEASAESSQGTGSNPGSVNITDATVATTRVQLTQSLTEMASGIAKNAADHTKGLGRKISG